MPDILKQASLLVSVGNITPIPLTVCNPHEAATMAAAMEFVLQGEGIASDAIEEYLKEPLYDHITRLFLPLGGKCSTCPLSIGGGDKILEGGLRKCRTRLFPPCALNADHLDAKVMKLYFKLLRGEA